MNENNLITWIKKIFSEELESFNFKLVKSNFHNKIKEFVFKNHENIKFIIIWEFEKESIKIKIILQGETRKKSEISINKTNFDQSIIINTVKEFMKFHSDYISNYNKNRNSSYLIINPNNDYYSIIQSGVCFDWNNEDNIIFIDDERSSSLNNNLNKKIYNEKDWSKFYQRYIQINENNKKFEKIFLEENNIFEHNIRNDDINENNIQKIDFMNFIFIKKADTNTNDNLQLGKETESKYKKYDISNIYKEFVYKNVFNNNVEKWQNKEILYTKYFKILKFPYASNKVLFKDINKYINENFEKNININEYWDYCWNYNNLLSFSKKIFYSFYNLKILDEIKEICNLDLFLLKNSLECIDYINYKDIRISFNISFTSYIYEIYLNFISIRKKIKKLNKLFDLENSTFDIYESLKCYLISVNNYFFDNELYLMNKLLNLKKEYTKGGIIFEDFLNLEYFDYINIVNINKKIEIFKIIKNYFDFNFYNYDFKYFHRIKEFMEFEGKIKNFIKIYNKLIRTYYSSNTFNNQLSLKSNKVIFTNFLSKKDSRIKKPSLRMNYQLSDLINKMDYDTDKSDFLMTYNLSKNNLNATNTFKDKYNKNSSEDPHFSFEEKKVIKEFFPSKNFKSLKCSICGVIVNKLGIQCMICGHGGHFKHIKEWLKKNKFCSECFDCMCFN